MSREIIPVGSVMIYYGDTPYLVERLDTLSNGQRAELTVLCEPRMGPKLLASLRHDDELPEGFATQFHLSKSLRLEKVGTPETRDSLTRIKVTYASEKSINGPLPEIVRVERVQLGKLLRGQYVGEWSGYQIRIPLQTEDWILHTKDGVRGRVPVLVMVGDDGKMEVNIDSDLRREEARRMMAEGLLSLTGFTVAFQVVIQAFPEDRERQLSQWCDFHGFEMTFDEVAGQYFFQRRKSSVSGG